MLVTLLWSIACAAETATTGARLVWNHRPAMGGSNQVIFLITALFVGQGAILGQGSAPVPLFGVLLGWAAAPAWTELVMMWPNRVGGISAACAEAFRPTGTCYWWGWVPTCGPLG